MLFPRSPQDPKENLEEIAVPAFVVPNRLEIRRGLFYLFFHLFLFGSLVVTLFSVLGIPLDTLTLNLVIMSTGSLYLVTRFKEHIHLSFMRFWQYGLKNISLLIFAFLLRLVLSILAGLLIAFLLPRVMGLADYGYLAYEPALPSPNQDLFSEMLGYHFITAAFLAVVLAPIWEELLFRSVLFAGVYHKGRLRAYFVSTLSFSFVHIMNFLFLGGFSPILFLTMLIYIPAGIVLCWVYEKSGNVITAMLMHGLINFIVIFGGAAL